MTPFISIKESFFVCRWLVSCNLMPFVGPVYKLLPVDRFGGLRVSEKESLAYFHRRFTAICVRSQEIC